MLLACVSERAWAWRPFGFLSKGIGVLYTIFFCKAICLRFLAAWHIYTNTKRIMPVCWYHLSSSNSTPESLKRVGHIVALENGLLDAIVHSDQFRHQLKDLVQLVAGDGNDTFQGVAEDNIALRILSECCPQIRRCNPTGETWTPPTETGTFLAAGFDSAPVPTVDVARPQTCTNKSVTSP